MSDAKNPMDPSSYSAGLSRLRRRRKLMGGLVLVYVPVIWLSLELTRSDRATAMVFGVWVILLFVAVLLVATGRCPRCNNTFHLNGCIPLYLRCCLHCGLHIKADKNPDEYPHSAAEP